MAVACVLHEPVPRTHDEFSYLLMSDTLASGHAANPSPPLTEFFDTFHVLVRPVYASKYFPGQGLFLAAGQKLTGHPTVGLWLSAALACAATCWMLQAWIGPVWGLLGGLLMVVQYGVYSYWSQSYWGGMVAALGGALVFGAARRLWQEFSWKSSFWLGLGIVILINSRPLEGTLALLPTSGCFAFRLWKEDLWKRSTFWSKFLFPAGIVLATGAFLTCSYNRAITDSWWKPPYVLHEQQYQESPQFLFQPMRPKLTYSSPWVQYYYEIFETRLYLTARDPRFIARAIARRLGTWWAFFCGILLTPALVIPGLLRKGRVRYLQAALLVGLTVLWTMSSPESHFLRGLFDVLALAQVILLWVVFDAFWPRLALVTSTLLIVESLTVKLLWPHYSAPAACLILYLQVEGLRRIWNWNPQEFETERSLTRSERRRLAREGSPVSWAVPRVRQLAFFLPCACVISLVLRVEARINGWKEDIHGPDREALLIDDWSLHRADLEYWLEQQPGPQLVFVWYSAHHRVINEWVYNRADLIHAKVIWARNLGAEHNRLLLQQFPDRTVWLVDADRRDPQLIPYSQVDRQAPEPMSPKTNTAGEQDQLDW